MATAATMFTPAERDYVRRELNMFFSTYPTVAEGFQLKTWRGGPQAGQAKLPPPARSSAWRPAPGQRAVGSNCLAGGSTAPKSSLLRMDSEGSRQRMSSNSFTLSSSVPIEMLVTRSRMNSRTTGT
jgi:hypothetical protein